MVFKEAKKHFKTHDSQLPMLYKEAKKHFKTRDPQLPMLYQMCWAETALKS